MKYDILITGAGAAGLMALKELSGAGYNCCLLEAAADAGGRILTLTKEGFDKPAEAGAEFIHGMLPLTLQLLKEGGIDYEPVDGKMISVQNGKWLTDEEDDEHWEEFMKKLSHLKKDCSIRQFLDEQFAGIEYENLHNAVKRFAEGFDLADITKASALSLQKEWKHVNDQHYRICGGYIKLTDYLLESSRKQNAAIHFSACVVKIVHQKDEVIVYTSDNRQFHTVKLIITVSVAVLQSGSIEFVPALPDFENTVQQLGFGTVIKMLLQFKSAFWKQRPEKIGFLLTDEAIPTWWTQLPAESNLLTGWIGGPGAAAKSKDTPELLLRTALFSLSSIFRIDIDFLQDQLIYHRIICWANQPYVYGGYSYNTLLSDRAKRILSRPINDTIFFAGEALFDGEPQGTVEAALQSGKETAKAVKKSL